RCEISGSANTPLILAAFGRLRICDVDCVRERRELVADPSDRTRTRAGDARGTRSESESTDSTIDLGSVAASFGRLCRRDSARCVGPAYAGRTAAGRTLAFLCE